MNDRRFLKLTSGFDKKTLNKKKIERIFQETLDLVFWQITVNDYE